MFQSLSIDPVAIKNIFGTGRDIYWYGILIACGVLGGILLAMWDSKRRAMKSDTAIDLALWGVLFAIVFARLYYVIFDTSGIFKENFWEIFNISHGGLAIYGGIIGGVLGVFIYSRIKKLKFSLVLDIAAPSLAFGQAVGRWGNFINQEAFGHPVTDPSMQWFPYAVYFENPKGNFSAGWFQATFFYESVWCLLICLFLILYRKRQRFSGELTAWYFVLYGLERSLVELLRTDQLWIPSTQIPVSSVLSVVLLICAAIYLVINYRKVKKGELFPVTPGSKFYVPQPLEEIPPTSLSETEPEVIAAEEIHDKNANDHDDKDIL